MTNSPVQTWLELAVTCDSEAVEPIAELFAQYGFNQGVAIEESFTQDADGDNFAVDPGGPVTVRTFINAADVAPGTLETVRQSLWHLGRLRSVSELTVSERAEEDWANAWKAHFSVHRVGNRVLVRAPWHEYTPAAGEVVLELDPGMAFGTGLHPSTQLSMIAVEDYLKPGDSVLDVGIGSGILATGAALLGASAIDGVDVEPVAVRSSRENAERNGVGSIIRVEHGSVGPDAPFQGEYDLVVANIIARVLIELSGSLVKAVRPGGTLILGGIIDIKEDLVLEAFAALGMMLVRRDTREDWVVLVYSKPVPSQTR
ncbi:MAG: 50S ribosomal protein L11 methyltransferase [Thermomicrobiales bacterium]|nr:50S ribosomal protein L11 methyltransferase [Thermomicrobiales bacterium]